jgi:hypothetical protein
MVAETPRANCQASEVVSGIAVVVGVSDLPLKLEIVIEAAAGLAPAFTSSVFMVLAKLAKLLETVVALVWRAAICVVGAETV